MVVPFRLAEAPVNVGPVESSVTVIVAAPLVWVPRGFVMRKRCWPGLPVGPPTATAVYVGPLAPGISVPFLVHWKVGLQAVYDAPRVNVAPSSTVALAGGVLMTGAVVQGTV